MKHLGIIPKPEWTDFFWGREPPRLHCFRKFGQRSLRPNGQKMILSKNKQNFPWASSTIKILVCPQFRWLKPLGFSNGGYMKTPIVLMAVGIPGFWILWEIPTALIGWGNVLAVLRSVVYVWFRGQVNDPFEEWTKLSLKQQLHLVNRDPFNGYYINIIPI